MKILIALDGSSCSQRVAEYVTAHPVLFHPENDYLALTVVPEVPPHAAAVVGRHAVSDYYRDEGEKVLSPFRRLFEASGYRTKADYRHGHAPEVIAQTAVQGGYDLVVMGSHGHSALGNLVMGSVTTKVLAHCKTPILIVR